MNAQGLQEKAVCSILEHTADDDKRYRTKYYNLDAILFVGFGKQIRADIKTMQTIQNRS